MSIARSDIDEARFGIRTAKASADRSDAIGAALAQCQLDHVELLILRIPTHAHAAIRTAEQAGARLTDTLCYFAADAAHGPALAASTAADVHFRPGGPVDADRVEALARAAFAGYAGHYHLDPRLRAVDADEVYPSWARRCCQTPTGPLVLAETPAGLAAFAALRPSGDGSLDVALLAVHPTARRRGVAAALLGHLRSLGAAERPGRSLTYSTQITNVAMQRVLTRQGFVPIGSSHTFHWWSSGDAP